jgi:ABC-type antimicrobial peptide transport system permease subunit
MVLTEAAVLTTLGSAAGVGIGWGVIYNFKNAIIKTLGNIYFLWPSPLFIVSIGLACVLFMLLSGAVSALYPAIRTSVKEPYDAIHQGM